MFSDSNHPLHYLVNVGETFLEIYCDMYYVPHIILVDTVVKAFSESTVSFSLFSHVQKKHEQKKKNGFRK